VGDVTSERTPRLSRRKSDAERWDARYLGELGEHVRDPDPFVLETLERLGPGIDRVALDLACGTGRHAIALARRGWRTSAWDVSRVALGRLTARAAAEDLPIETRAIDLTAELDAPAEHDLVVLVDYLDRALFPRLWTLLGPGGAAVITTFTEDCAGPHPSARHRLARGELARGIAGLQTLVFSESGGRARLLATRPGSSPRRGT
jgi:SAM-dependent methyltransferase